jgi:hypothetical protein
MSEDIPEWAWDRVRELVPIVGIKTVYWGPVFARYITEHEQPPVDPDRAEAIAVVLAEHVMRTDNQIEAIKSGQAGGGKIAIALAGIKRGRELERGP